MGTVFLLWPGGWKWAGCPLASPAAASGSCFYLLTGLPTACSGPAAFLLMGLMLDSFLAAAGQLLKAGRAGGVGGGGGGGGGRPLVSGISFDVDSGCCCSFSCFYAPGRHDHLTTPNYGYMIVSAAAPLEGTVAASPGPPKGRQGP